jgi:uncharacterized protein YegL
MSGLKIESLNAAIRDAVPAIRDAVKNYPQVQIVMRAIKFADKAEWHVGPQPVDLDKFLWTDLDVDGQTATSQAIHMLRDELTFEKLGTKKLFPPVCILVSDGHCTDSPEQYDRAIGELLKEPWGRKAVRLAIAIGGDESEYDEAELKKFISHDSVGVLKAKTPADLVNFIRWASVSASVGASQSKGTADSHENVNLGLPPQPQTTSSSGVF